MHNEGFTRADSIISSQEWMISTANGNPSLTSSHIASKSVTSILETKWI